MEFVRQLWSALGHVTRTSWVLSLFGASVGGIAAFMQEVPLILIVLTALAFFVLFVVLFAVNEWKKRLGVWGFEVSGPECLSDNRNAERREVRLCRVKVKNIAGKPLKNCQVRMASFTDKDGKESREVGRHLWLSKQRGNLDPLGKHPRQQKRFDMSVDAEEWVDVAYLDPAGSTKIRICYARNEEDEDVFINFGGVASHAPYKLTISATSDDCREERMSLEYSVNEGELVVQAVDHGPARAAKMERAAVL